jgi:hypothetical protein
MEITKENIIQEFESKLEILWWEKLYRARNIMNVFWYYKWERFEWAIKRTMENFWNENIIKKNFFPVERNNTWWRPWRDYLLTKWACYFLIKNCDNRKDEVNILHNYLKETYNNQKIKKDLFLESKNIIFINKLKISLSLLFIFSLVLLTIYFIFDFKNDIKDTKINVYNELKKLENNNLNNPNINTNNEILTNSWNTQDNIELNNEKQIEDFSNKLQKYIWKWGGEKFIEYSNNPRTEFTITLTWTKLIESYFLFWNNSLYKDSCSLLSKKYCNALSKDLTSFKNTWTTTNSWYELVDLYEKVPWIYCVKTKSTLKEDSSNNPLIQIFSYKTFTEEWIEYINWRFCEKIEKNGKNIPCPYKLSNYYCLK